MTSSDDASRDFWELAEKPTPSRISRWNTTAMKIAVTSRSCGLAVGGEEAGADTIICLISAYWYEFDRSLGYFFYGSSAEQQGEIVALPPEFSEVTVVRAIRVARLSGMIDGHGIVPLPNIHDDPYRGTAGISEVG